MKKWYESKTIWLAFLQWIKECTALVTAVAFPNVDNEVFIYLAMFGLLVAKAQAYIRTLPDHGKSITANQETAREVI